MVRCIDSESLGIVCFPRAVGGLEPKPYARRLNRRVPDKPSKPIWKQRGHWSAAGINEPAEHHLCFGLSGRMKGQKQKPPDNAPSSIHRIIHCPPRTATRTPFVGRRTMENQRRRTRDKRLGRNSPMSLWSMTVPITTGGLPLTSGSSPDLPS